NQKSALVVSGEALGHVFSNGLEEPFLHVGTRCHSVICCRVTPLQKAQVVKLVRSSLKKTTLAIGDGANDVAMIQAANIGVGIMGREGTQAVRASDYAFAEFRFLRRLLSVHGRYSYNRIAQLILYSFYKNLVLITVQWYFGFFSGWSGQGVYEEVFLTSFNVIFTSIPPLMYAIFERDVEEVEGIERYPQLYKEVREGRFWNLWEIGGWMGSALWHSALIFFSVYFIVQDGVLDIDGSVTGYWVQCYMFGTPVLTTVMLKMALATKHWVWLTWASIGGSLLLNVIVMFLLEALGYLEAGTADINHVLPAYWLTCVWVPVACCLPDLVCM
ncbi:hypothetical protein HK102_009250, partial [Quaeritorhiza haematococci]